MAATVVHRPPSSNKEPVAGVRPRYLLLAPWRVRPGAGVNNVILGLSQAVNSPYQPEIFVTNWDEPEPGQASLKLPPPALPLRNLAGFCLRLIPNFLRIVRLGRGAAALNPHYFGTEILPLAIVRRLGLIPKLILSVHGADVTHAASQNALQKYFYRFICRSADVVIACSAALAEQVRTLVPGARVVPVWNGVSEAPAQAGPRPFTAPYLVSISAFVWKKGHDVMLDAFQRVSAEFPELHLILIGGDGPERPKLEGWIQAAGLSERVRLIVSLEQDQVWRWVRHAECFVHAAREEPFGIAVLEAALLETPVVTTAVGGIREYLVNRVDGLTCEADNAEQLAAGIRETLGDPAAANARAQNFRKKARGFTWQAAWDRYRAAAGLE